MTGKPPIWSKNCSRKPSEFEELIFPDEIHDLLRWSDWNRDTVKFLDRRLAASGEQQ